MSISKIPHTNTEQNDPHMDIPSNNDIEIIRQRLIINHISNSQKKNI